MCHGLEVSPLGAGQYVLFQVNLQDHCKRQKTHINSYTNKFKCKPKVEICPFLWNANAIKQYQ